MKSKPGFSWTPAAKMAAVSVPSEQSKSGGKDLLAQALGQFASLQSRGLLIPSILVLIGLLASCYSLWPTLPVLYENKDGYYSHGPLIPLMSGYIIYLSWPRIKSIPVKPTWIPVIVIVPLLILLRAANSAQVMSVISLSFIGLALCSVWFLAGWKWLVALCAPITYLVFCLPVWSSVLDTYTNPLQLQSTSIAFRLLSLVGVNPVQTDPTTIFLDHFTLSVAVPCSGVKLMVALIAFGVFFVLIGGLKWWGNLIVLAAMAPLCLLTNGLRIALIGLVGNQYGEAAGHQFHDYSGYITLVLCFFALFQLVKALGWKGI